MTRKIQEKSVVNKSLIYLWAVYMSEKYRIFILIILKHWDFSECMKHGHFYKQTRKRLQKLLSIIFNIDIKYSSGA